MEKVTTNEKSYFEQLNNINVSDKIEKKNNLSYLSWAWAWGELKKYYPEAQYKVYENVEGLNYHHDTRTAWVKVGVIVNQIEHIEYLPVMNHRNQSIPLNDITSFNVNTSIQRCLTKAIARHGLGLYIYAGEDLPEDSKPTKEDLAISAYKKCISHLPQESRELLLTKFANDNDVNTMRELYKQTDEAIKSGKIDNLIEELKNEII